MNTRPFVAAAGVVGIAVGAGAQTQTAQYHVVFTSPTASSGSGTANIMFNNLLISHVVTAQVMVSFNPGVGQPASGPGTLTGTVMGLASGGFTLVGAGFAGFGSWLAPYPPTSPPGPLQTPYDGTGSAGFIVGYGVNNVVWGTGSPFPPVHPSPENPDNVWQWTFHTMPTPSGCMVNFSFVQVGTTGVWALPPGSQVPFLSPFVTSGGPGGSIRIGYCPPGCYADCDHSGALTIADFGCFQNAFVASQQHADCDASGTFSVADFGCFQSAFVSGCP